MVIGGCVAMLVQMIILPTKARVRLKESLAAAIVQINKMESCIALGVDETKNIISSPRLFKKFARASKKAETALAGAETYLGYCKQEPRLKGSFEMQGVVYKEVCHHTLSLDRANLYRVDHIRLTTDCGPYGEYAADATSLWVCGS